MLRSISPDATPEEIAAIVAVVAALDHDRRVALGAAGGPGESERLDAWVRVSRLGARRLGLQRGPWRLYGRIARRSRV